MKAAVINNFGEIPHYSEFPDPIPGEGGTLVHVKASVLENFDKLTAGGTHYSSKTLFPLFPAIPGTDGIGMTEDGRMVAFGNIQAPYGAFAEKVVAGYTLPIPVGIDPAVAAAVPASVLTSLLPLKYTAQLQPGETVLINGATGVSGRIAVQVAKMLGAGRIIGTGRNENSLNLLKTLGADEVINITQPDDQLAENFARMDQEKKIDAVLDFLWGHPAEVLLKTFIPKEVGFASRRLRYMQTGEKAGSHISLPASALRTSGVQLMGMGPLSHETLFEEMGHVWEWVGENKFYMDIEQVPLSRIDWAWQQDYTGGRRFVIMP